MVSGLDAIGYNVGMSPIGNYVWNITTQQWVASRLPSGGAIDRSTLVYGTYKPDGSTTGTLPNVALSTRYVTSGGTLTTDIGQSTRGQYVINTAGVTIENLDIHGGIRINAANVTIKNCRIRGWDAAQARFGNGDPIWRGSVDVQYGAAPGFHLIDCEITCEWPTELHLCVYGDSGGTVERCNIYGGVDQFRIWSAANSIIGSWLHEPIYYDPTEYTPIDGTHSDLIQFAPRPYSGQQYVMGNWLDATMTTPPGGFAGYTPTAIMLPNQIDDLVVDKNWIDWGAWPINVGGGASPPGPVSCVITNNVIYPGWVVTGGTTGHIIAPVSWQAVWTQTGNTDRDSGGPIRVKNG